MSSGRLVTASERSKLEPFIVATGDASPRDQRDLMERPFFSLAKARRTTPILYEAGDIHVEVYKNKNTGKEYGDRSTKNIRIR
jgi:plasmid replication initiation protein